MTSNLYLVDGTFEIFRAYFSFPSSKGQTIKEVGACRGLLRSLVNLINLPDSSYIACAFDHTIESFRNDLFSGYKTGDGIEPELANQFQLAEDISAALGLVVWPMIEFEADDAIATAAYKWENSKAIDQIIIASPDKDLCQAIEGNRIILWDRIRNKFIDEDGVSEKFGITPQSIPDYLALVGDAADGIPGLPKWGAKSSSIILEAYKTVENIPLNINQWPPLRGASGLLDSLIAHREELSLYKTLATLRRDVPIQENLKDLRYKGVNWTLLEPICKELGDEIFFKKLANQLK